MMIKTNQIKNYFQLIAILLFLMLPSCIDYDNKEINYREGLSNFDAGEYPNKSITDGPYMFYDNGETIIKWRQNDEIIEKVITQNNFNIIEKNFGFKLKAEWLEQNNEKTDYSHEFKNIERFIALSDIHGQYKLFVKILREYEVIDENNNWIFDTGHLVIVGDIFDRGDQVNEILWLVFKLEHQAKEHGGHLHYLIGNHEEMILNKDLRYVHQKYLRTTTLMNTSYDQLFSSKTVLGQWLRTKPVISKINDVLIVHAGISPEFVDKKFTIKDVNRIFSNTLIGKTREEIKKDSVLKFLKGSNGPIWYRGYFRDNNLTNEKIDHILNYFNSKNMIVGHSTQEFITPLFDHRIFGIDSRIKGGKYGEVLIYDKGDFFRGTIKMSVSFSNE